MTEIWKVVKGYSNLYQVSNKGRVKSLEINAGIGSGNYYRKEKILKLQIIKGGYNTIRLSKNKICNTILVHRIVADAFIPNPLNKCCINHIDGNKTNNIISNLEWATYSENAIHAYNIGLRNKVVFRKPVCMFTLDNDKIKTFKSLNEASEQMNIYVGNISACCNNKRKTAGGYKWEFYYA